MIPAAMRRPIAPKAAKMKPRTIRAAAGTAGERHRGLIDFR
jgi:hypothetical protein